MVGLLAGITLRPANAEALGDTYDTMVADPGSPADDAATSSPDDIMNYGSDLGSDDVLPLGFIGGEEAVGGGLLGIGLVGMDGLSGALLPGDARGVATDEYLQATQLLEQQALSRDALDAARRARDQAEQRAKAQLVRGARVGKDVPYADIFNAVADQYSLDPRMLAAVARSESGLREDVVRCVGVVGVRPMGIMGLDPSTAASYGANPCDPGAAIDAAGQLLRGLSDRYGSWPLVFAAYRVGAMTIDQTRAVPTEQVSYVATVQGFWDEYKKLYPEGSAKAAQAVELALSKLGVAYVFGAGRSENPTNFDCSGLTWWAYHKVGIQLGTWTMTQKDDGERIASYREFDGPVSYQVLLERALPGDLILLKGGDGRYSDGYPGHIGLYIGDGKMVHAPRTGDVVKISALSGRSDIMYIQRVATD